MRRRHTAALLVLALLLLAGCRSMHEDGLGSLADLGRRIVPNDWRLVAISHDERTLMVETSYGGEAGGCNRYAGVELDERAKRVSLRMLLSQPVAVGACTDDLSSRQAVVRLKEPLGDRDLVGCGGEAAVCRSVVREGGVIPPERPLSALLFADGVLIFSHDAGLTAFDADDGTVRWRHEAPEPGSGRQRVTAAGDVVVLHDYERRELLGLDAASGRVRWRTPETPVETSLHAVRDGRARHLVAFADAAGVAAHDASSGALAWRADAGAMSNTALAVGEHVVLVHRAPRDTTGQADGTQDGEVVALDAATGAVRWRAETQEPVHRLLAIADTVVGYGPGARYAWESATGAQRWRLPPFGQFAELAATAQGALAFDGEEAVLFDPVTSYEVRRLSVAHTDPWGVFADGDRLLLSNDAAEVEVRRLDGAVIRRLPLGGLGGRPAIQGDLIAVPTWLGVSVFDADGLRWWWVREPDKA